MANISTKRTVQFGKEQQGTLIGTLKRARTWRHQIPMRGWGYTRMCKTGGLCEDLCKEELAFSFPDPPNPLCGQNPSGDMTA